MEAEVRSTAPAATAPRFDTRTRVLLEGPIASTLLRLATPNVLVMFVKPSVGLIETYFVAKLGTNALAVVALFCPTLLLINVADSVRLSSGLKTLFVPSHCSEVRYVSCYRW